MSFWRHLTRGMRALTGRAAADRELADELSHYLHEATAAHVQRGLSPGDARRAAMLEIGNATAVEERVRGAGWEATVESFVTDLRYSVRMLRKNPLFALVTIVVIALGTGAVTTIFSATNSLLLRPLPGVTDGARLVSIDRRDRRGPGGMSASYPFVTHLRERTHAFSGIAAWNQMPLTVTVGGAGHAAYGNIVSGSFFSVLGVHAELGRLFGEDDDRAPLASPVMVISDGFWRTVFGGDSTVIGREVRVNGHPYTIVGVVPRAFRGVYTPLKTDAWVPVMMTSQLRPGHALTDVSDGWFKVVARLAPGTSRGAAERDAGAATAEWAESGVEQTTWARSYSAARLVPLTGLPEDASSAIVGFFLLLLGASALVLLIASVNVAAMLGARAIARRREMAVRAALGAGRGRLIRQLLTETVVLFTLGALGGIAVAAAATRALERLPLPDEISLDLSPDYRAIAFALLASTAMGIAFGLAPALQAARTDVAQRIRDDSPGGGSRKRRASNALIVAQLALSLLLLVGAGLFLRAFASGSRIDPGFDATGVSIAAFNTEAWGYDDAKGRLFYDALRERVAAIPGVTAVSYTDVVPLTAQNSGVWVRVDGAGQGDAGRSRTGVANVADGYFDVVKIPLLAGRAIARTDDARATPVAVVNETFAKTLWPDGDAVGRTFTLDSLRVTVAGVARDAKYAWLTDKPAPFAYFPAAQRWQPRQTLMVRASGPADRMAVEIRRAVNAIDASLPYPNVTSLRDANAIVLVPQRVAALVTLSLGSIGLLMATVGLYGIVSHGVNRRRREIGIRIALGARRGEVLGMVVRGGMRLAAIGVALGLTMAAAATRLMSAFLFNVSPLDALTFVAASAIFLGVTLVASYLPARRAAAADPMTVLRVD